MIEDATIARESLGSLVLLAVGCAAGDHTMTTETESDGAFNELRNLLFAERILRDLVLTDPRDHPGLEAARLAIARSNLGEARAALRRLPEEVGSWSTSLFTEAYLETLDGDVEAAKRCLRKIVDQPDPFTYDVLQAWKFLRDLGGEPNPAVADQVLGVIVEVVTDEPKARTTVMAGFADGQLRWLRPDAQIIGENWTEPERRVARRLVEIGGECAAGSAPADRGLPVPGGIYFYFLAPGGIRRVTSSFDRLDRESESLQKLFQVASEINEIGVSLFGMATHALTARQRAQALHNAICRSDPERVRMFLSLGADANARVESGMPALAVAVSRQELEIVQLLLARGAQVHSRASNERGLRETPIPSLAASNGSLPILELLLDSGADVDAADATGVTALMSASFMGHRENVEFLVGRGATLEAKTIDGYTALMYAAKAGQLDCVAALLEGGADVGARDQNGNAPLAFAAQHGYQEVVRLFLAAGSDPTVEGIQGFTAVDLALQNGHAEVVELLRSAMVTN